MLHGKYAFTLTGQILAPALSAGPVSGVAETQFDGAGNLTQVEPCRAQRHRAGGRLEASGGIVFHQLRLHRMDDHPSRTPQTPRDGGPDLKLYIVVTRDADEIHTVVSGSPTAPPFASNITSVGIRSDSREW